MVQSDNKNKVALSGTAVAEVVHELRAPLGGIEAMADLLARTELTPAQDKLVRGLQAAAAHLRAVANDVLDNPASHGQGLAIDDQCLDLAALVQSIAVSAEARATARDVRFVLVLDGRLSGHFRGDGRRIRQMLENLLDNAIKMTSVGSITLTVDHVDHRGRFEGLKFTVADTGPGFTPQQRDTLFKAFGRLDNGVKGTGLGLSLVRRLAQAMGGEAGCAAVPGQGAEFWFTLRLKRSASQNHVTTPDRIDADQSPVETSCRRILVVDDNAANRMIMAAILEHFGYETVDAESGEMALALLGQQTFLAVMLDQTLPGLSGVETLLAIRAMQGAIADIPVIPVTGRVSAADRKAFAQAGANGFVEKPVTARAVRDALEATMIHPSSQDRTAA